MGFNSGFKGLMISSPIFVLILHAPHSTPPQRFGPIAGPGLPLRGFAITLIGHTTVGRTPLDEWSARRRDLYLTTHNTHNRQIDRQTCPRRIRKRNPSKRAAADQDLVLKYVVLAYFIIHFPLSLLFLSRYGLVTTSKRMLIPSFTVSLSTL